MRALVLIALLLPGAALADLYRWVDPQTGSVRLSNVPPPAGVNAQVVPFRQAAEAPPAKAEKAAAKPPVATPAPLAKPSAPPR